MKVPFKNRSIIWVGGTTLGLTLPKEILDTLDLHKGGKLDLLLVNNEKAVNNGKPAVIIVPAKNPPQPKK